MSKSELVRKVASLGLCILMVCTMVLPGISLKAEAVSYSGRGSKSDPYLVETAQQLQGMNENLSAHYKLANTIDLAGVAFTPIGNLGTPFTGSFVCDVDSDGTPKYAIKNLTVSIEGLPNYADYVKGKSKWQAALFGAANGATFTNIAVLDMNLSNTVVGLDDVNSDWSANPGMDDMATAGLVGQADNVTISGCSATGVIDSLSNATAGLVGYMRGGSVTKSYAKVTIKQTGKWNNGGLVGMARASATITESFAESDLTGAKSSANGSSGHPNTTGGLVGGIKDEVTIKNCYSTGAVAASGNSLIGDESGRLAGISDCYATGKVADVSDVVASTNSANCYVLNAAGCCQKLAAAASEAEIKAAFSGNAAWDTSGSLPKLKNVAVITDTSKYVPSASTTAPGGDTSTGGNSGENTGGAVSGNVSGTQEAAGMSPAEYAAKVADLLPKAQNGELTIEEAFEVLTLDDVKAGMTSEEAVELVEINPYINDDYDSLISEVKLFLISAVVSGVDEIPEADAVTEDDMDKIFELYALYERLPEEYREAVNDEAASKLEASYEKAHQMKYVTILEPDAGTQSLGTVELVLIITFGIICLAAFAGVVITTIRIIRFTRKEKSKA